MYTCILLKTILVECNSIKSIKTTRTKLKSIQLIKFTTKSTSIQKKVYNVRTYQNHMQKHRNIFWRGTESYAMEQTNSNIDVPSNIMLTL